MKVVGDSIVFKSCTTPLYNFATDNLETISRVGKIISIHPKFYIVKTCNGKTIKVKLCNVVT